MYRMYLLSFLLLIFVAKDCQSQDEEGPYRGNFIGKLNSYHHQVSGDVYAVDEWTILLVNFNYDGTGDDTFFWAGDSGRPGPQGFIVPDEHGKTNVLERYHDAELRLKLLGGKQVARLKWLAIYDIGSQNTFGDVYIPDEFEPPAPHVLSPFVGTRAVSSGPVTFTDAKTFVISDFRYDGTGKDVYFWTGVGPQPSSKGQKIPDEYGYLEPLKAYNNTDLRLQLPGDLTAFEIQWLSVWDSDSQESLSTLLMPDTLNVPPALNAVHSHRTSLPHCVQLHTRMQVSWEVFGGQLTIQLAGQVTEEEYMAFGISGAVDSSRMLGADVAVAAKNTITDYNITALAPCVRVLDQWRGVCRDDRLGHLDSNQLLSAKREDSLNIVTYRRQLQPAESIDLEWPTDREVYIVWAIGTLDADGEPGFHTVYPKDDVRLNLTANPPVNTCVPFARGPRTMPPQPWDRNELSDPALRAFTATLGPGGGLRGYSSAGRSPVYVWYMNGLMAPDLQLRRGLTYTFRVLGGNNPHSADLYHPLIITTEPRGGLERLDEAAQRGVRVLAGVGYTRRGRTLPTAVGPLCVARHPTGRDRRRDDEFSSFRSYNRSLVWNCESGNAGELIATPNTTWPDVVYYQSYTHAGMGGVIRVVDRYRRTSRKNNAVGFSIWPLSMILPVLIAYVQTQ